MGKSIARGEGRAKATSRNIEDNAAKGIKADLPSHIYCATGRCKCDKMFTGCARVCVGV